MKSIEVAVLNPEVTEGGLASLAVGPKTLRRCGRLDAACMARKRAGTEFHGRRRYAVITRAL